MELVSPTNNSKLPQVLQRRSTVAVGRHLSGGLFASSLGTVGEAPAAVSASRRDSNHSLPDHIEGNGSPPAGPSRFPSSMSLLQRMHSKLSFSSQSSSPSSPSTPGDKQKKKMMPFKVAAKLVVSSASFSFFSGPKCGTCRSIKDGQVFNKHYGNEAISKLLDDAYMEFLIRVLETDPYERKPFEVAAIHEIAWGTPLLEKNNYEKQHEFCRMMTSEFVEAGAYVFKQGQAADAYYIVIKGEAEVLAASKDGNHGRESVFLKLGTGFGEMAMLQNGYRNASVRASLGGCLQLMKLTKQFYHRVLDGNHLVKQESFKSKMISKIGKLRQSCSKPPEARHRGDLELIEGSLHGIKFFSAGSNRSMRRELCRVVGYLEMEEDGVVFHQGDPGDIFYMIIDGTVEVIVNKHKHGGHDVVPSVVATLGDGACFGELALINNAPRAATIRCRSKVYFLTLTKEDYARTMKKAQREGIKDELVWFKAMFPAMFRIQRSIGVLAPVIRYFEKKKYEVGEIVHERNEPLRKMGFILSGKLLLWVECLMKRRNPETGKLEFQNKRFDVKKLGVGDCLGGTEIMNAGKSWKKCGFSVTAEEHTEVAWLDCEQWRTAMPEVVKRERFVQEVIVSGDIWNQLTKQLKDEHDQGWDSEFPLKIPHVIPIQGSNRADNFVDYSYYELLNPKEREEGDFLITGIPTDDEEEFLEQNRSNQFSILRSDLDADFEKDDEWRNSVFPPPSPNKPRALTSLSRKSINSSVEHHNDDDEDSFVEGLLVSGGQMERSPSPVSPKRASPTNRLSRSCNDAEEEERISKQQSRWYGLDLASGMRTASSLRRCNNEERRQQSLLHTAPWRPSAAVTDTIRPWWMTADNLKSAQHHGDHGSKTMMKDESPMRWDEKNGWVWLTEGGEEHMETTTTQKKQHRSRRRRVGAKSALS